ncbi:MAG: sugar phosphate isomerase/epimerase [Verrucomicrobia bacterium]|nr:sugar phosphate isomerase/epimerase [Verrucomicrobiota bacterium]MCH8513339.1 sugar phosphate isomerase/epimerase [Kiritimatiellia bacterium]
MSFQLTGISDEAGATIEEQIRAHRELGWTHLELRKLDGEQVALLPEERCRELAATIADAGLGVAGLGSPVANGARKITDPFEQSLEELASAMRNAAILGTDQIRVMTYPNDGLSEADWQSETVKRLRELGRRAADAGIFLLVENCSGWAASTPDNFAKFFEMVNLPSVRAVYDTGNPASHHAGPARMSEWFAAAQPHLRHVHIKDHTGCAEGITPKHLWPGEGVCRVRETLETLAASGYDGFISIEPHLGVHPDCGNRFETYVEYGRRLQALLTA